MSANAAYTDDNILYRLLKKSRALFCQIQRSSPISHRVSDRRSTALNWEGVVPSHVRKAR